MVKADNFGIEKLKKQFFVFVVAKTTQKALSSGFFYFTFQNLPQAAKNTCRSTRN